MLVAEHVKSIGKGRQHQGGCTRDSALFARPAGDSEHSLLRGERRRALQAGIGWLCTWPESANEHVVSELPVENASAKQ